METIKLPTDNPLDTIILEKPRQKVIKLTCYDGALEWGSWVVLTQGQWQALMEAGNKLWEGDKK